MNILKAVLPVIAMILIGMLLREKNVLNSKSVEGLQALVMNVTLPISLFGTFYKTSLSLDVSVLPAILFVLVVAGIFLGKFMSKLFRLSDRYMPFMLSGYENGMLGYALLAILAGAEGTKSLAVMDIGHTLAIFTVYIAMLKNENGEKQSASDVIKGLLKTPVLVAAVLGAVVGISGLGGVLSKSPAGAVVDELCDFISAPTGAAILCVIGYRMKFSGIDWKNTLKACGVRILMQAVLLAIVLLLLKLIGGICAAEITILTIILVFILPPPYILPLYIEEENKKEFYSSALSIYTLLTIIGFIILAIVKLG